MGNFQQLRMQSLLGGYDQLTPGAGGGFDEYGPPMQNQTFQSPGLAQVADQQQNGGYSLGSEPESQPESIIQAPTVDPIGAPGAPPRNSVYDLMDAINKGYTPATSSRDRYDQLLNEAPRREAPSWARALTASALSVKAQDPVAMADKVSYAPYYRNQADWTARTEPFFKAAELENRANINERTLVSNAVQAQTAADRLAEQARQADQKAELTRQRNMIADYVARGLKVVSLPHSPTIIMAGPDGKPFNTGVPTGALSEAEAIRSKGEWMERAADTRAASAAANQQGEMVTYTDPTTGKQSPGQRVGNTIYPLEMAQPGQRPGQRQAPVAPGTTPAPRVPGKQVTGPVYKTGTEQEQKALTPQQQRVETSNKIDGIISRHPNWRNYVNYNPETKLYEGMGDPPQAPRTAGFFGIGGGGASDEDWTRYKDDMDGYNHLRSLLHPEMPPAPVVGGSNAEQKAARQKQATTPVPNSNKVSTEPARGIGPSGSTNAAPSAQGSATIGPTNVPNNSKSLPGGGGSTTQKSEDAGTWMPDSGGRRVFLPDWMQKESTPAKPAPKPAPDTRPNIVKEQSARPAYKFPDLPVDNRPPVDTTNDQPYGTEPKPLPANVPFPPRGARLQQDGNQYRYTVDNGNTWYVLKGNKWVKAGR